MELTFFSLLVETTFCITTKVLSKYPFTFSNVKNYLACNSRYYYGAQHLLIFKCQQNFNGMRWSHQIFQCTISTNAKLL